MAVDRRLFLGGFTVGAVTVAASGAAAAPAAAAPGPGDFDTLVTAPGFRADSTVTAASFRTTSTTDNAVTVIQGATSGGGVALNIVSHNPEDSAVYLTGRERKHGTLKISHIGDKDGNDAGAAAISIELHTPGTAAQGIFVTGKKGVPGTTPDTHTTGNLICLRNNGRDEFVVKGSGRVGIGMGVGSNPWAQLHVVQQQGVNSAVMVEGSVRVVDAATVPTAVDQRGGGVLYAEDGALKWLGSGGKVTVIAASSASSPA
ncbi:hyaluronoglucosaminidase [Streptomyces yaizuensis]|uniref:Hyaluronoglucosaminidase n=1 Tax=Streptomyces yaizuensis TaxID=2989713 RepID=A0ABQ5NXF3_9ACTN|nr:hyaluronoglucosaminidase [Streptomyces sp. YSPA8]GLF95050.1 hyaluronoglucosaminidase [Streptomyces sp. YSPA8]